MGNGTTAYEVFAGVQDEAAKLVIDSSRSIADVAREIDVNETTLGKWVAKYRNEHAR